MKLNFNKQKNTYLLLCFYLVILSFTYINLKDFGIHIEEKFHRLNGLYWLNYSANIFGFEDLTKITNVKINEISDYSLSNVSLYNKYGVIFDLPTALIEILFSVNDVKDIYYIKHFLSFLIFSLSSYVFFKILKKRFKSFFLSFVGLSLYISSPRIFGDSFFYKDVLYLSFITFTLYFFLKCMKRMSLKNIILFSLFTALSVNLRIFSIIIPFIFCFIVTVKGFYLMKTNFIIKKTLIYFLFFLVFLFISWPYLWSNPIYNFLDIFSSLNKDLVNIKILYDEKYLSNRYLPDTYLFKWIFISTPVFQNFLFFLGFILCALRIYGRLIKIETSSIYNDLWRSRNEETDFILFMFITVFFYYF